MATPEQYATQEVQGRLSEWKCRMFRNNSGACTDDKGRLVRYGLGNTSAKVNKKLKSGDLIGFTPITITQEMVGATIAVFTNIEVKTDKFTIRESYNENSREWGQNNFNTMVINQGGIAGFARNWSDVDNIINSFYVSVYEKRNR